MKIAPNTINFINFFNYYDYQIQCMQVVCASKLYLFGVMISTLRNHCADVMDLVSKVPIC